MKIREMVIIFLVGLTTYAWAASSSLVQPIQSIPGLPSDGAYRLYLNPGEQMNLVITNSDGQFSLAGVTAPESFAVYIAATYRVTFNTNEAMPNPFIPTPLNEIIENSQNEVVP